MLTFLVGLLFLAMIGCVTRSVGPVSPLSPYQVAADILVSLEDECEDSLEDAQTLTTLEATADMLAMPLTMAVTTLRLAAYVTVGLGMVLAGTESKMAIDHINWVLPLPLTGPNPDRIRYHPGMVVKESCLVAKG